MEVLKGIILLLLVLGIFSLFSLKMPKGMKAMGALAGVIVALYGLINNATGTATPIAGLMVMYGFNNPMVVTKVALMCALAGLIAGYIGYVIFKNYKIKTIQEIRGM